MQYIVLRESYAGTVVSTCSPAAMAPAALQMWKAVIEMLQALGSDDTPVVHGCTPCVIVSKNTADAATNAVRSLQKLDLRHANKNTWSKLLSSKVSRSMHWNDCKLLGMCNTAAEVRGRLSWSSNGKEENTMGC